MTHTQCIGYMLMAVRACHMTALQEERIESAMFHAFKEFTPQDAQEMYDSLQKSLEKDEYSQLELVAELQQAIEGDAA